jgi:hypothetical protein
MRVFTAATQHPFAQLIAFVVPSDCLSRGIVQAAEGFELVFD